MSEIINKFNIFRDFPPNLRQNIKSFHVSRYLFSGLLGYCVLNEKKVYGFGERIQEILGYNKSEKKYVLINELCDKNIIEFYHGKDCMFARSGNNEIFSWGWNHCGQLARGFDSGEREYLRPEKISFFDGMNIIAISCGDYHCLALSSDGRVFGWGRNWYGEVGRGKVQGEIILTPIQIEFKEKIQFIHCSRLKSFAVSFDGNAYYWGGFGEPAIFTPKLIALKNVLKIYCDSRDVFIILDNNGKVFEFNPKNEKIIEIKSEVKFNDIYCQDQCLLQSQDCVYELEDKKLKGTHFIDFFDFCSENLGNFDETIDIDISKKDECPLQSQDSGYEVQVKKLIKTDFIDFFDFCSQNLAHFEKTIHITNEGLLTKEIQLNGESITLKDHNLFQINYGKFAHIKQIGSGAYGTVMKVEFNQKHYAIKRIEFKDELDLKEIEIMSKLKSDFVIQYIRSWIETMPNSVQFIYIQMELSSHNLREFIELMKKTFEGNFKTFQYFISCEVFKELIEGVNYLHSLRPPIIHRDLKPENILISKGINGRFLKLCDFGVSKIHEESIHTRMAGTMKYMAPEVLKSKNYNTKSEIYSLTLIATEIFSFEDKVEEIKEIKTRKVFDKYLSKYLNTNINTKFIKLLDLISNCLLPEDYHSRPDCKQILEEINEWFVDKNIVINDSSISLVNMWELNSKLRLEKENTILKEFIENKFHLL